MLAAAVIAVVFVSLFLVTWLTSRADAAQARCDEHVRHIHRQLEIPPTPGTAAGRAPRTRPRAR